jgi:hypothetical protein
MLGLSLSIIASIRRLFLSNPVSGMIRTFLVMTLEGLGPVIGSNHLQGFELLNAIRILSPAPIYPDSSDFRTELATKTALHHP